MSAVSFKKPLKKTFRKKQSEDSDDDEASATKPSVDAVKSDNVAAASSSVKPASPIVLPTKSTEDTTSTSGGAQPVSTSKLSFENEEDESEEFRVKKSNRSRKIAKKLKDEWKEDQYKPKGSGGDEVTSMQNLKLDASSGQGGVKSDSPELEILNGEDFEEDDASLYRRPTAPFGRGKIPDDKLIADAKKQREEARKAEDDFIPLEETENSVKGKSRLVREDENDLSDEDAELVMSSNGGKFLGSKDVAAENRRRNREFFEFDEIIGEKLNDSDEEIQRWEEAQIRKGVPKSSTIQALSEELNRPPPDQQYYYGPNGYTAVDNDIISYAQDAHGPASSMSTVEEIRKKIRNRMEQAKDLQRRHNNEWDKISGDLADCNKAIESLDMELKTASSEYRFYQEMRGFVLDLIDCYNDKLPQIIAVEDQTLAIWKRGCRAACDLRQQFIKDRSDEIQSKISIDTLPNLTLNAERRIRLADYQERRKALAAVAGIPVDSFDMDEYEPTGSPPPMEVVVKSSTIFEDTVVDFKSLPAIIQRFVQWRRGCSHSYNDAYIAHCFPKLVAPLIRFQLLGWNPLKRNSPAVTEMPWLIENICQLFGSNTKPVVASDDPDTRVLPMIIEDVIFTRLTVLLEVWDPMSQIQSTRLVTLLRDIFSTFPSIMLTRKPVQDLVRAIVQRFIQTIEDDVYLPVYSQRVLETDKEANQFVSDQFQAAFKLFCNILMFHDILSNAALVELSLERLLNRYLLVPLRTSHNRHESVSRCVAIASKIPDDRLCTGAGPSTVPKHLEMFCHVAGNLGKQNPNRNEVSDLSQILLRFKDFKGAEVLEKQLVKDR